MPDPFVLPPPPPEWTKPEEEGPGIGQYLKMLAATGVRVAAPGIGAVLGGLAGNLPGAIAGGAGGGAAGEVLAEWIEGSKINPKRVGVGAVTGAIPGTVMVRAGKPLVSAVMGAGVAGAGVAGNKWAEGKSVLDPASYDLLDAASVGLGAGVGGAFGKFSKPNATPKPAGTKPTITSNGVTKPYVEVPEKNPVRVPETSKEATKAVRVGNIDVIGGAGKKGQAPPKYGPLTIQETLDKNLAKDYAPAATRPHPKLTGPNKIEDFALQQDAIGQTGVGRQVREAAVNTGKAGTLTLQKMAALQDIERRAKIMDAAGDIEGARALRESAIADGTASTTTSNTVIRQNKQELDQVVKNENARDKFVKADQAQTAKNENLREKAQGKLVDNPVNQAVNEAVGKLATEGKGKAVTQAVKDVDTGIKTATQQAAKQRDFNAKFEADSIANAEKDAETFLQDQFGNLDDQLVTAQRDQATRLANQNKLETTAEQFLIDQEAAAAKKAAEEADAVKAAEMLDGLEPVGDPSAIDRVTIPSPDGGKTTVSQRFGKPAPPKEEGGGTPAPPSQPEVPLVPETGPSSTIYTSKEKALIAQGQRGAIGIVKSTEGKGWRLVYPAGQKPKETPAAAAIPVKASKAPDSPVKATEAPVASPEVVLREPKTIEDIMASQGITAGNAPQARGLVVSPPEGVVLSQKGQAQTAISSKKVPDPKLTKSENAALAPVTEVTSTSGPWNRSEFKGAAAPKSAAPIQTNPIEAAKQELRDVINGKVKFASPKAKADAIDAGRRKIEQAESDFMSDQSGKPRINLEETVTQGKEVPAAGPAPKAKTPAAPIKVAKEIPPVDTSKMTEAELKAYYKKRAPQDDLAFILKDENLDPTIRTEAEGVKKPTKGVITGLRDKIRTEMTDRSKAVGEPQLGTKEWHESQIPYGPETPDPASNSMKPFGPEPALKPNLGSEAGVIDPALAVRLGTTLGGAAIGGATDDEHPLRGAAIGAGIGAGVGFGGTAAVRGLAGKVDSEDLKKAAHMLPDYYRANLLLHPTNLPMNMWFGPYGSTVMGGLEHALAGDPRGMQAIRNIRNPKTFMQNWNAATDEAKDSIAQAASRFEGASYEDQPEWFRKLTGAPGQGMTAGDIVARNALMDAGFSEEEAMRITLTSEPYSGLGKGISALRKGAIDDDGDRSVIADMLMPFYRTAANQFEQSLERTPGLGMLVKRPMGDSPEQIRAQQVLGTGVTGIAYSLGRMVPTDAVTARMINKAINNLSGQYGTLASLAFAAGQAAQKGKSEISGVVGAVKGGDVFPLPTAQPIADVLNNADKIIQGNVDSVNDVIPQSLIPGGGLMRPNVPGGIPWAIKKMQEAQKEAPSNDFVLPPPPPDWVN